MENFNEHVDLIRKKPEVILGLIDLIIGPYIGSGSFRDVYQHATNENWVVKIQRDDNQHSNIIEYELWGDIVYTDYKKWFAPIHWMSHNGKVIIQEKTRPITKDDILPDKIPSFITDVKQSNFGFIGKQLVCHDYDFSLNMLFSNSLNKRMKSAKNLKVKDL